MKYLQSILFAILFAFLTVTQTYAVTPTPTVSVTPTITKAPSPADEKLTDQINKLKEKIASRVAELKLVEKRGVIGTVVKTSDTQLTINDVNNKIRLIDVDEITKFSSPSAKGAFGISDITKGSRVAVIGLYNKQSKRILARFVDVITTPVFINGTVKNVDTKEYTITIVDEDGKQTIVDIEKITKTLSYTKEDGLVAAGFSKITAGQRVNVIGYTNIKEKNRVTGSRIIVFPELPRNPRITIANDVIDPKEDVVVSSGSGKKLTPITK